MSGQKSGGLLPTLVKTGGAVVGGWLAYSKFVINHKMSISPALNGTQMSYVSPKAKRLNYYYDDSATGKPLVLIHSINAAASAYEMKPLFDAYRTERPVYALDLPGFGFSDRSDRDYLPGLYKDAIIDFLENVVQTPADLIALSLGSEFAGMVAKNRPDLVSSLVLLSPTGFRKMDVEVPEDTLYGVFSFPLWSQPFFDLLVTETAIRYFLGKNFAGEPADDMIDYAYKTAHQPGARYAPLHFISGKLFTTGVREKVYTHITTPTLVIYDRDPNVTFDALPAFINANDNWQSKRVAPTMGLPHWEKTVETIAALDTFWTMD